MIQCIVSHRLSHESKSSKIQTPIQQTVNSVKQNLAACSSVSFPENGAILRFVNERTGDFENDTSLNIEHHDREHGTNGISDENCSTTTLVGKMQNVSLSGKRARPYVQVSDVHKARIAHISSMLLADNNRSHNVFTSVFRNCVDRCQTSCHSFCDNKKSIDVGQAGWLSVGHLMSMGSATSLCISGSSFGLAEMLAWEGFAPLQRVLVLVVAAAAAAKHINMKEIKRLKNEVDKQEQHTLLIMGQELANLWDQVLTQQSCSFKETFQMSTLQCREKSMDSEYLDTEEEEDDLDMQDEQVSKGSSRNNSGLVIQPCTSTPELLQPKRASAEATERQMGCIRVNEPVLLEERDVGGHIGEGVAWSPVGNSQEFDVCKWDADESQCSSNKCPLLSRGFSGNESAGSEKSQCQYSSKVVPQKLSLDMEDDGENTIKTTEDNLTNSHAPDAALFLEIKRQVELQIEKAASDVFAAFSSVISKVQDLVLLENSEPLQTPPYHVLERKSQAIKKSVEHSLSLVLTLQTVASDLWQALSSEALAALNLTPEEIQNYLSTFSTLTSDLSKGDGDSRLPSEKDNLWYWKQRLNHHDQATNLQISKLRSQLILNGSASPLPAIEEVQFPKILNCSCSSTASEVAQCKWQGIKTDVASAIGVAVRKTIDTLVAPLDDQNPQPGLPFTSTELVVEQLLGELEKAATKVAGMEAQMISLKEYVKASETKRKQAEQKVADLIEYDIQNQAKAHEEATELTQLLRSKEVAYEELLYRQKVLLTVKAKELADLHDDCMKKDSTLREVVSAYQVAKNSNEQKLAVLEDICRRKDNIIASLKHQITTAESRLSELRSLRVHSRQQKILSNNGKSNADQTDVYECTNRSPVGAHSIEPCFEVTPLRESTGSVESNTRITSRLDMSVNSDCKSQLFCKPTPVHHAKTCCSGTKTKGQDSSSQRSNGVLTGVGANTPIDCKKPSSDKESLHSTPNGKSKENADKRRRWV
ncbi:hypothetical protein O6H91_08G116000 [Diphasiastrum complanatum]|uniref:Uncharacterized protein n=2 Tax=Diphasiastrum complanatum TaxID=34168 RepID=A0ACC2D1D2_DIPCM|nr:hypothetical protein O6H91_08G116000 [Diphasiastrum complanatum]